MYLIKESDNMSLDKTIRENLDGKYIIIHANHFNEGIEYARQIQISQIQLRGILGKESIEVDFQKLEGISETLRFISFAGHIENIVNFECIYSLKNIEKIDFQQKQSFTIDISKFNKIVHLGSEYWKGLSNVGHAYSLESLVIIKLPSINLKLVSGLKKLEILHIYSSKITTLEGIEGLPIKYLSLAMNRQLEDIKAIMELSVLERLSIEKCKKIADTTIIDSLQHKIKVEIIK